MCAILKRMAERTGASIRARVRAELIEEIKAAARRQLATEGANLSLRAIAREMGMASSALYRYFASRDDLLTALIIDAYDAIGEAAEKADARHRPRHDYAGRWLAAARALRSWALDHSSEYALIHGSPVPGYRAPADTTGPASRVPLVLTGIVAEALAAGALLAVPGPAIGPKLAAELVAIGNQIDRDLGEQVLARAMLAWTEMYGALSFELFGQLNNVIDRRADWFDYQARSVATFIGL